MGAHVVASQAFTMRIDSVKAEGEASEGSAVSHSKRLKFSDLINKSDIQVQCSEKKTLIEAMSCEILIHFCGCVIGDAVVWYRR